MRVVIALHVQPSPEGLGPLLRALQREPYGTFREVAGRLLALQPRVVCITAAEPGGGRHRWDKSAVTVPWSAVPGSLYTCVLCGATKRHLPPEVAGGVWVTEYAVPGAAGTPSVVSARRPRCPGAASPAPQPRRLELPRHARRLQILEELAELAISWEIEPCTESAEALRVSARALLNFDNPPASAGRGNSARRSPKKEAFE